MIYLDHAATSPLLPQAREAMLPYLNGNFGNPSGLYEVGREAQSAVDGARSSVAACIGARPAEVIFTSGGTESIYTAMFGIAYALRRAGAGNHIVTTAIEHHAALHTAQSLEEMGFDVTYLGCDSAGKVLVDEFERALRPDTVLASVMFANNEVGTLQPIAELAGILRSYQTRSGHHIAFHTDAVQAPEWFQLDVEALGVDALSLSSHKFGGPKGSGVLYLRRATPFRSLFHGGGQEMQKRAGTENVAGIVGTATALAIATNGVRQRTMGVRSLRSQLREGISRALPDAVFNGCDTECLPNNLNVSFAGVESDAVVANLDRAGVAASSGSACSNSTWEPSHVLIAMGVPIRRAVASVRFSLGESNTPAEVDAVLQLLPNEVAAARSLAATT